MANSLKLANRVELRCLWAPWPQFGLDLSPLDNYDIIGTVALFGRHGVTWGDLAVTAKSPQVVCHLPDVGTPKWGNTFWKYSFANSPVPMVSLQGIKSAALEQS